ncbi:alcohol dehydrogenase catalytic domain-containing protein, partial [Streptomyces sp. NPDC059506]|uniref:alcohol dehydrogenase catalytic domain-containing protein n=1 Tax=Streptomyces sp. NPDC059506 TaxID=3347751 RepID=UPI00368F47E8
MRVMRVTAFGGPEVLVAGEAPEPVAGPGQVVVEAGFVPVVFVETQLRQGRSPGPPLPTPPYVPGGGVAGTVVAVGEGVDPERIGARVVTRVLGGGCAQRALAPADALVPVPDGLGLDAAAALLNDGATALGLFAAARVRPGEWVLVEAAAGGVGSLLVQAARAAGAGGGGGARGAR